MTCRTNLRRLAGGFVAIVLSACVATGPYQLPAGDSVEVEVLPKLATGLVQLQAFRDGVGCNEPGLVAPAGHAAFSNLPYRFRLPATGVQTAWAKFAIGTSSCEVGMSFETQKGYTYAFDLTVRDAQCVFSLRGKGPNEREYFPVAAQMKRVLTAKSGGGTTCTPITMASFNENTKARAKLISAIRGGTVAELTKAQKTETMMKDLEGLLGK